MPDSRDVPGTGEPYGASMGALHPWHLFIGGFCCLAVLAVVGGIVWLIVRSTRKS